MKLKGTADKFCGLGSDRKDQLGQNSQKICTTNYALLAVGIRFSRRRSSLNNAEPTSRQNRSADTSVGYSSGPKLNYFFAKIKLLTFGQKEASHNYACFEKGRKDPY